jgi:hypothetical protein
VNFFGSEMRAAILLTLALWLCTTPAGGRESEVSFVNRVSAVIASKDVEKIAQLAGHAGAQILPFGTDTIPPPNQRHRFAKKLLAVLGTSAPVCVGYHIGSDKTVVFYRASGLDWSRGGLAGHATEMLALHFYRPPNASPPWKLLWVTPISWDDIRLFGDHRPC